MNGALSVFGLLLVAVAIIAAWVGLQRGNGILLVVGVLILAVAAWNIGVYLKRRWR